MVGASSTAVTVRVVAAVVVPPLPSAIENVSTAVPSRELNALATGDTVAVQSGHVPAKLTAELSTRLVLLEFMLKLLAVHVRAPSTSPAVRAITTGVSSVAVEVAATTKVGASFTGVTFNVNDLLSVPPAPSFALMVITVEPLALSVGVIASEQLLLAPVSESPELATSAVFDELTETWLGLEQTRVLSTSVTVNVTGDPGVSSFHVRFENDGKTGASLTALTVKRNDWVEEREPSETCTTTSE